MKKMIVIAVAALMCICCVFSGCTGTHDKSPDKFKKIRWITSDYSFCINPEDGCKGFYKFNGRKYNIKAEFKSGVVYIYDTDKKNTELFNGDWSYDKDELYIYGIMFNKKAYKDFETNYAEHVNLHQEKLK